MSSSEEPYNCVLVRYGEIALKGGAVRRRLEERLKETIIYKLRSKGVSFSDVKLTPGRIIIRTEEPVKVAEISAKVFGVVSTSPAIEVTNSIDEIRRTAVTLAKLVIGEGESFAVRARRVKIYPISSKDIERVVGADILNELGGLNVRVDLTKPDKVIYVEVRARRALIYDKVVPGVGGLPAGSSGRVVALISGGIDSPVATWLMMRRGCEPILLHLDLGGFINPKVREKIGNVVRALKDWYPLPSMTYVVVPYEPLLKALIERGPVKYTCVLCRRGMLKVARLVAEKFNAKGIVTGESLGQVASQTLENIHAISRGIGIPVFRPLIAMDKEEIIALARRIGTYDITSTPALRCRASPVSRGLYVTTRADPSKIDEIWDKLRLEDVVIDCFRRLRVVEVRG